MNTSLRSVIISAAVLAVSCGGADPQRPASNGSLIPHERLLPFLPTLPGWTREGAPQGDTDATEGVSRVQVNYGIDGGISGLSVEIMDTTGNAGILAPLQEFIKANKTEAIGDPTAPVAVTPIQVKGFFGRQEWQPHAGANNGAISLLVADRFTVGITGNSLASVDVMKAAAEAIDLKKLAALK